MTHIHNTDHLHGRTRYNLPLHVCVPSQLSGLKVQDPLSIERICLLSLVGLWSKLNGLTSPFTPMIDLESPAFAYKH